VYETIHQGIGNIQAYIISQYITSTCYLCAYHVSQGPPEMEQIGDIVVHMTEHILGELALVIIEAEKSHRKPTVSQRANEARSTAQSRSTQ
jgi:hypothetical protein